ncbi:MAG: hypothetical protein ACOYLQ_11200 [Hyphomicrobiaceae bacterium]|jgi:hypothetical protein
MVLPNELRQRLQQIMEQASPLGRGRLETMMRDVTLTTAQQVIAELEGRIARELKTAAPGFASPNTRVVSARSVLPEFKAV